MTTTEKKLVYLKDLHFEHRLWMNELNFAKDEMDSLTNRWTEIKEKNTDEDFTFFGKRLHKRLVEQKKMAEELICTIKVHEKALAHHAEEHPIGIDEVLFYDHTAIREKMTHFTTLYTPLKAEFMNFVAKWM